ncbi:uncharacterized protein LOC130625270 [Hydractinia symbiolongicarpus]|uniref:uncharacterized protein LOC130625270 n=1 Tax=Hydractinia symbiolongicarpus TaxID=13093 RepID=UPI00254B1576|nr:uncharacterized protein LOC130625270 [Hydractinia symbiolongicarpus]
MKVPMPYDEGFSENENPYSSSGYAQICREYGADPNAQYKFKALMSSLTNGSDADNFTERQILLQKFEAMVQPSENVGHDITEFQKFLKRVRPGQEISRVALKPGSEKIPQSGDGNPHDDTKATLVTAGKPGDMRKILFYTLILTTFIISSNDQQVHYETSLPLLPKNTQARHLKRGKSRVLYYSNCSATFNLILDGDIEVNPGPGFVAPKCSTCSKVVRCNQKRLLCSQCLDVSHAVCQNKQHLVTNSRVPYETMCDRCLHTVLPFLNVSLNTSYVESFKLVYKKRKERRGGGVAAYVKDDIDFKLRNDITTLHNELEHIWIEINGRNRHSKILLGVFYQPNFDDASKAEWLSKVDIILDKVVSQWRGHIVITGDMNINLLENSQITTVYNDILDSHNLVQHVTKPSRRGTTLIDHFITNAQCKPRFKYIRDYKNYILNDYVTDFSQLPLSVVYSSESADDKLDIFNELISSCIERHAPLKRIKVTRPPAPWLKDLRINDMQSKCRELRHKAHLTQSDSDWDNFRDIRNNLKRTIKHTRKTFFKKALSSKRPADVWKFIHQFLNAVPTTQDDLLNHINNFQLRNDRSELYFRHVTYTEVETELKSLRMDCSAGFDNIPVAHIKPVLEYLISPLTHVINSGIDEQKFHTQWKIGKVSPIPKCDNTTSSDQYRPVSVLSTLSKVYERCIANQICEYISSENALKDTMSGFRKHHSTTTLLLKIRYDIIKAMEKGEVTLAMFLDYSKAFDTVDFKTIITKLYHLSFSKPAVLWMFSYLNNRLQYVQIDDCSSSMETVQFGVPQGSVLGPIFFNLYVTDLQDAVHGTVCQFADDTSCYDHCKQNELPNAIEQLTQRLDNLCDWSFNNNLAFNQGKTKIMLFSGSRMSQTHKLDDDTHVTFNIKHCGKLIERVASYKLLGVHFDEHLAWDTHLKQLLKSTYCKLSVLRKLKHSAPQYLRKQLVETLLLSRLDYCNVVFSNAPDYKLNRINKVLRCAAAFVTAHYCTTADILNLKWLPSKERINLNMLKLAHKSLHETEFPTYLKGLEMKKTERTTRSSERCVSEFKVNASDKTFIGRSGRQLNDLPTSLRKEVVYKKFVYGAKCYLSDRALAKYINKH